MKNRYILKTPFITILAALFISFSGYAQLSGSYTINSGNPTSGSNFNNFADFTSSLKSLGVGGAVNVTVVANSGPYYEQIKIDTITGANAFNTVTINGNGNVIATTPVSSARYIIQLNGARYVTIDSLVLYDSSATYGWGIHLYQGANYNTIKNCVIDLTAVTSTSTSNAVGIVATGSMTSVTTGGDNASYCTISGNFIKGGTTGTYYGIRLNGNTGGLNCVGNTIVDNTIQDMYAYNIYLDDTDSTLVEGNDISRPNKVSVTSFYGIYLTGGNRNVLVSKNRIHNSHDNTSSSTGAAYVIYLSSCDAPTGSENIISNNIIHDINSSGTIYALYNLGSDGAYYYYNTVSLDYTSATGGTTRGFYQSTTASNIIIKNNNISITRGGSGVKHGLYFNTSTSSIVSDNNNIYVNSQGSGSQSTGRYNSVDYATLANWQTANSNAYDQNSVAADPLFVSSANGDFTPASSTLNNVGTPISGISTDINGATRNATTPDPGAYEFTPPQDDAGVISVLSPVAPCPGTASVEVTVQNFGAVTLDSVRINWSLNGVTQPVTYYSNPLATGNDTDVVIGSFTVVAGNTYDIVTWTSYPNGNMNDANTINDTSKLLNIESAMTGIYTVGTSGNYTTLVAAVNDLNARGICGPVTFNVDNATYAGQLSIGPLLGTSAVNTVTFNGSGATISAAPTTTDRYIVKLDGASYVTLDSFNIVGTSVDYGWGLHLTNASDYCTLSNSTIDLTALTSTSSTQGVFIVASGSGTSATTSGNNANYCTIENNTLLGGSTGIYYGIRFNGNTGGLNSVGNKIINNTVSNVYTYSIYLDDNDGALVQGNDISRATKTTVSTFYGIYLTSGNRNVLIEKNKIHNTHDSASSLTGSSYGIYFSGCDAPVGSPNVAQNNLIYNLNSNGTIYAIYNSSSDGAHYYYNTVSLDHTAATAGITRGFYQTTTASDIIFQNNIISITRGGSGIKHGMYFNATGSTINCNYNDLYINSQGSGSQYYGRYSSDYSSFTSWQTANSGAFDQNSDSLSPEFLDISGNDYMPNSSTINGAANHIIGIYDDHFGVMRDTITPDIGAIEFTPIPTNDSCANAIPVMAGSYSGTTNGSTTDMVPSCGTTIDSAGGVWYVYSGSGNFVEASLCGSTFDTKISVFTGICDSLICIGGNDDSCGTQSIIGGCTDDMVDYYILVHGKGSARGDFTLTITETPVVKPTVSVSPDSVFCDGDTAVLTSSMAVEYLWNDLIQSTSASIEVGVTGAFAVTTTDSNGCMMTSDTLYTIANPLPVVDLGNDTTICDNASITLDAGNPGATYAWSTGESTQTITYDGSDGTGTLSVTVTDGNGCDGLDEIVITVDICSGIAENGDKASFGIYPNPNNGDFVLDFSNLKTRNVDMYILSITGEVVYSENISLNNSSRKEISLNQLTKGVYFVQVRDGQAILTQKLIVK